MLDPRRTLVGLRSSYGGKLAAALLLVVALTVTFGTAVGADIDGQLREDVREEMRADAELRGAELSRWIVGVERETRQAAAHPAVVSGDRDRVRSHLRSLADGDAAPEGVVAVDYYDVDEGRVLASSAPDREEGGDGQSISDAAALGSLDAGSGVRITEPFRSSAADAPVVAVAAPVPDRSGRAVVYVVDVQDRVGALSERTEGRTVVVNAAGTYVAHPDPTKVGSRYAGAGAGGGGADGLPDRIRSGTAFTGAEETVTASTPLAATDWVVMTQVDRSAAYALGDRVTSGIAGLVLLLITSLALIGATVGTNTAASLRDLSRRAETMADGDLDVDLGTRRRDEFGTLYRTFSRMRDSLREQIGAADAARERAEAARSEAERAEAAAEATNERLEEAAADYGSVMREVAEGDLTRRVDTDIENDAMRRVGEAFNDTVSELERTVGEVSTFSRRAAAGANTVDENAAAVRKAGEEIASSVDEISAGAERQSGRLDEVSEEIGDLSAGVEEVASTVEEVATVSERTAAAGERGRDAAEAAIDRMAAVEDQSEATVEAVEALDAEMDEIGEVVEVITGIAEQTNLLALNASIEAARSGRDGDGFGVVADEIKALAEETKGSAAEIESRIEAVQSRTESTVEGIHETSDRLDEGVETVEEALAELDRIVARVEELDGSVREIAAATDSQADSASAVAGMVEEAAATGRRTSSEATSVASAAEEQTTALHEVNEVAADLSERTAALRSLLDGFAVDTPGTDDKEDGRPEAAARRTPAATDGGVTAADGATTDGGATTNHGRHADGLHADSEAAAGDGGEEA